jgi:hypothetical protein
MPEICLKCAGTPKPGPPRQIHEFWELRSTPPRESKADVNSYVDEYDEPDDPDDATYQIERFKGAASRYSDNGSYVWHARPLPNTTKKTAGWHLVQDAAGRKSASAAMGNTSALNAAKAAGFTNRNAAKQTFEAPKGNGSYYEWLHLIADCLGGPTTPANLVAASYHANTAMMQIERAVCNRTDIEVQVEADVRTQPGPSGTTIATDVAECITYRMRRALLHPSTTTSPTTATYECKIDGLACGCTSAEGKSLYRNARQWILKNSKVAQSIKNSKV